MALDANDSTLTTVFDTERESEALVVQGLLESAGIDAVVTSLDSPQDLLPGVGGVVVQVAPEQAEEARTIIADYRNRPIEDSEFAEGSSA
jgi:hypothetical protein